MSRRLAIFDLDGTLARTSAVDDECWVRAVRLAWGIDGIDTDWSSYRHSTDEGIAAEVMETHLGRAATRADLDELRDCFAQLIEREARERPERFEAVPGAPTIMSSLRAHGWVPALATGGWRRTALVKLATAGVPLLGVPAAFADDAWPREELIRIAAARAGAGGGGGTGHGGGTDDGAAPIDRIVYVGDGVWDVTAARARGYGFVGVATGDRGAALRRAGATTVLEDLADVDRVVDAIERGSRVRRVLESRR